MPEEIEKTLFTISNWEIKAELEQLTDEAVPFEITEEMVEEVRDNFLGFIQEISNLSLEFFEKYDEIFSNAVFDALYDKAMGMESDGD